MDGNEENRRDIYLNTKEQLTTFMNPVRQQLLRQLQISGRPMTPKALSDKMLISASSIQHHVKKLMALGVIDVDHTESINGINATYYKLVPVSVHIYSKQGYSNEKRALLIQLVDNVFSGFMRKRDLIDGLDMTAEDQRKLGDVMTGVAYITEQERGELISLIDGYIKTHEIPGPDKKPWEYAMIMYDASEAD